MRNRQLAAHRARKKTILCDQMATSPLKDELGPFLVLLKGPSGRVECPISQGTLFKFPFIDDSRFAQRGITLESEGIAPMTSDRKFFGILFETGSGKVSIGLLSKSVKFDLVQND